MAEDAIVMDFLNRSGSFLSGHFRLTSGLHSGKYLQCAQVFKYPDFSESLARMLAGKIAQAGIVFDTVVSPALGGILFGYEISRQAKALNIFAERDAENRMSLRRGFQVAAGERCLVVEDVITTGGSVKEVIELVRNAGGVVVAVGGVADRSRGKAAFDSPFFSLVKLDFETYQPEACPLCASGEPVVKPGSRKG